MSAGDNEINIILPGTWFWIPLDDDDAMRQRIVMLVKRQLGMADRLATRRRETRDQLVDVAKQARDAGAISFALALELAVGVPFPASLMISTREWQKSAKSDSSRERLTSEFPRAEILDQRSGPVARIAEFFEQRVEGQSTPTLRCEYWIPIPGEFRLLEITISAPTMPDPQLFTQLFDSIVDSVTWGVALEPVEVDS